VSVNVSTTPDINDYELRFVEPAFLGRDVALGFALSYQDSNFSAVRFESTTGQFQPFLGFSLGERSSLQLRYTYTDVEMSVPAAEAIAGSIIDTEAALGRQATSEIGYTYTYDTRIGGLNPDAGFLLEFGQDIAGPGSDVEYVKTTARAVAQTTAFNGDVTLRASVEGGALYGADNTRAHHRFALTSRQFRGFDPYGIGPREVSLGDGGATINDGLGGKFFAVARFEAEFPLGLPEEYGISGGVFYDVGSLWGADGTAAPGNTLLYNDFTLRQTVGVSLFWTTPIGPLQFNWSRAVSKEAFDDEQNFNLTIRTEF
jgi:outer membrane protein insertion porin family